MKILYLILGLMLVSCSLANLAYSNLQVSKTVPSNGKIINILFGPVGFETGDLSEVEINDMNGYIEVASKPHPVHGGNFSVHHWINATRKDNDEPKRVSRVHPKPWDFFGVGNTGIRHLNSRAYFYIERWEPIGYYIEVLEFDGHTWDGEKWVYNHIGWCNIVGGGLRLSNLWGPGGEKTGPEIEGSYSWELNRWYCIEFEANLTENGYFKGYVDGELIVDTGIYDLSGAVDIDRCWAGILISPLVAENYELFTDDWIIADGYIGP